ncbi:MAG TPA: hypothetical protein VF432_17510 [Thermoanaerobaculia bacterium]
MTTYSLNIDIDPAGLSAIYNSNQRVTLVKSVGSSPSNVAWISFEPFGSNTVTWTENYLIYGTVASVQAGAAIVMTSQTAGPAQEGLLYTFGDGQFSGAPGGTPGSYDVQNQQGNGISFGLAQLATINGAGTLAPLNAVEVNMDEGASFIPIETVSVYLTSLENNGVVISRVAGNALVVTLDSQNPSASLGFDDKTNAFFISGSGSTVTHADLARRPGSGRRPQPLAAAAAR